MTTEREPRRLALEVRFDAEPIEGRVYEDGRVDRPFSGWLGLMAAIDAARHAHAPPPSEDNGEGS
jgi:hypothetical protein